MDVYFEGGRFLRNKRNTYLIINIILFVICIDPLWQSYLDDIKLIEIVLAYLLIAAFINVMIFASDYLSNKIFNWYEKRSKAKYSLYEWLGYPYPSIDIKKRLSDKKNFTLEEFEENCKIIKKEISLELRDLEGWKSYKKYLELKIDSPRFSSLLSSSQSILIAVIGAAVITFLNVSDKSNTQLVISYIFLFIAGIGLAKVIDLWSSKIDRDRFLLVLVNEYIEEKEKEVLQNEAI